jgi:two-component system, OmpR family, copper resistance phosphate regulon response regulator CusR
MFVWYSEDKLSMKLLIIEDNRSLAKSLKNILHRDYLIDIEHSGRSGVFSALTSEYDLIILDLQLPDMTGLEICQNLRQEKLSIPILILTGKNTVESKIVLLNSGADDYLTKPFSMAELKARIKSLLRRSINHTYQNQTTIGALLLNTNTKSVMLNNKPLKLSKKEFMLLHYFMKKPDISISRLSLFEHVWEGHLDFSSNIIDVHICNLRRKLHSSCKDQIIKTVHGDGYMLESSSLLPQET